MRRLIGGVVLAFSMISSVHAQQSPLLELVNKLHCAATEKEAAALLSKLSSLSTQPFGIPSDISVNEKSLLYAASVDIVLKVLYDTILHYPALQESAERTALLWNYCHVMTTQGIADLSVDNHGDIVERQAMDSFPEKKQGLRIWGFLKPDPANRHRPKLIQEMAVFPLAHQELVFNLVHQQCFPDPDTGTLITESNHPNNADNLHQSEPPAFGSTSIHQTLELSERYPYFWQSECTSQPPKSTITPPKSVKIASTKKTSALKSNTENIAPSQLETLVESELNAKQLETARIQNAELEKPKSEKSHEKKPSVKTIEKNADEADQKQKNQQALFLALKDNYIQPEKEDILVASSAVAGSGSNSGAILPLPPKNGVGLAGNFYNRSKLTGAQSVGANVGWRPISNFFIRAGGNYNYYPDNGDFSYSWGIGYDDWHPGTISVQLNNWGPLLPSEGLALKKAVANIGYKFEASALRPYHIAGSAGVNIPIAGGAGIVTTWSWMPIENWFVRASLQKKFGKEDGVSWTYSFGYFDWHPFTFSLTYDNSGVNQLFDAKSPDAFNFQENGAVSLSWSWAF